MQTLYPGRWARDLLERMHYPRTQSNIAALMAWSHAEGGHTNGARWNPLNTTQPAPGATSINSVGVKSYTSYEQGMAATIKTLKNGYYPGILAALKKGTSDKAVTDAVAASPWGTGSLAGAALPWGRDYAKKHPSLYADEGRKGAGAKGGSGPAKARKQGSGRKGSARSSGPKKIAMDLADLDGIIRVLRDGRDDATTARRHVASAAASLEGLAVAPEVARDVRKVVEPLTSPTGALAAVPRHLDWEAELVRDVRTLAEVADGGGTARDRRRADRLLAQLAKGQGSAGTRIALAGLFAGNLKVRHSKPGSRTGGAVGGSKGSGSKGSGSNGSGSKGRTTIGTKALAAARKEVGTRETSPNYSKRIAVYEQTTGAYRQAWCASFVTWALRRAGKDVKGGAALAGVATYVRMARNKQQGMRLVSASEARPGDLVAYDWGGGTDFGADGHIGILASKVHNGSWKAVEGNTGMLSGGGEGVELKSRTKGSANVVYIRVTR